MTKFEIYSILENVDLVKKIGAKELELLLRKIEISDKENLSGAIKMFIVNVWERKNEYEIN